MKGIWAKLIVAGGILLALVLIYFMFGSGQRYKSLTQEEAAKVMDSDADALVVDVRTRTEYDGGHIPGALCVPIDDIRDHPETMPEVFPDKHQVLLVYCYTGRRAVDAAKLLTDMGYVNTYEFGGIVDWKGEVVTDE